MTVPRLDIDAIKKDLRHLQSDFPRINAKLYAWRDPLEDIIIENMLSGYDYLNWLIKKEITVFSPGGFHHLLELNHIVLCGRNPDIRKEHAKHIEATSERFYNQPVLNIGHMSRWYQAHLKKSAWHRAAGFYILHLSQPQLFFEGNHRTGALIMSFILVREGKAPFVLTVKNAEGYLNPSTLVKSTHKGTMKSLWKLPKIRKHFKKFLKENTSARYLLKK